MKGSIIALFATFIVLIATVVYAEKELTINDDCVYLDELTAPSIVHKKVTCGFAPGESKFFPKEVIENYLRREGINAKVLNDVTVTRQGEKLSSDEIISAVTKAYKNTYPEITVKVEQLRTSKEIFATQLENFSIDVDTSKFGSTYATINNGIKNTQIYMYVKAYKEGYISSERIKAGEVVENKVRKELIDITNSRQSLVTDITGIIAAKGIPQGKAITVDLVQDKPALAKGESVKLVFDNGTIKIETMGIVEENAFVGKLVQVRNAVSQKIIMAQYLGNGVAKAQF